MKNVLDKLLKYIIPQRIALQIGSWKTYIIGEDGDVKDLQSSVIVEKKSEKNLVAGYDFVCIDRGLANWHKVWPIMRREVVRFEDACFYFNYIFSKYFYRKSLHIFSSVSPCTMDVEFRALIDAIFSSRQVSKASFVFEPIAAAIGMGLDLQREIYILDIGHTASIFSVISDNELKYAHDIYSPCIRDEALSALERIKIEKRIHISKRQLMHILSTIKEKDTCLVYALNAFTHEPMNFEMTREQVISYYSPTIMSLIDKVKAFMIEKDISLSAESPLYLIGGGSCLAGIREMFAEAGLEVIIPKDSNRVIALGLHKIALEKFDHSIDREKIVFKDIKSIK